MDAFTRALQGRKWGIRIMAEMNFDEEGLLDEPCLSCEKSYIEDIWLEWCCDEKECVYRIKSGNKE